MASRGGPPKEYASPLLQAPLNRLFIPRPTFDYLPPTDRDETERTYVRVSPTAQYMHLLTTNEENEDTSIVEAEKPPSRKERALTKWRKAKEELEAAVLTCTYAKKLSFYSSL